MSNDLASRQHAATPGHGASRIHHGDTAPGKRPLVEQVQMPAIQMHGAGEQSDEAVHAVAAPASAELVRARGAPTGHASGRLPAAARSCLALGVTPRRPATR
jgi:hypothetical protein